MTTAVVDRPVSGLNDNTGSFLRQRPSVVEVIDVDLVDESTNVSGGSSHSQGASDVISIPDSDDDDDFPLTQPVASGGTRSRPTAGLRLHIVHSKTKGLKGSLLTGQRNRLFSPPPPPQDHSIPQVPRVPRRYSGFTSLPMRQRPPPYPSPPVRVRDEPFDFEANIRIADTTAGPSNATRSRRRRPAVELTAARPSHHTPSMGLGGGLISLNRAHANDQRRELHRNYPRQNPAGRGVFGQHAGFMRTLYSAIIGSNNDPDEAFGAHDEDDYPAIQMLLARDFGLEPGNDDNRFDHPARPYLLQEILFRGRGRGRNQPEDYKPEYTHPGKAESGFTFDFAPSSPTEASSSDTKQKAKGKEKVAPIVIDLEAMDVPDTPVAGPSTAPSPPSSPSLDTLLVCAKCLDPLVLGAGLVGEEGKTKKVWALRCGHLIDGKCLDSIGVPDKESDDQEIDGQGKGKTVDLKGKGKAKAAQEESNLPEANPIRSRLRSSALLPSSAPISSRPTRAIAPFSPPQPVLGKRKRTSSSSAKSKIEATHEWECPVAGCKRMHVSVKIGGSWVPEPDSQVAVGKGKGKWCLEIAQAEESGGRGAVAIFV
jgi:hypothetical protein